MRSLSILVHGLSKTGKTHFGETSPAPRLELDAEGGTRFTPSVKTYWDPLTQAPPTVGTIRAVDGTETPGVWETCVVYVRDMATVNQAYIWLASGQHPFRSVIMDSISEVQQKCVDSLVGTDPMKIQNWGDLLRHMSDLVRKMRDLTIHPSNPLEAVVIIAMTRQNGSRYVPYVQGQLATTLPYYIDVTGYFFTVSTENGLQRQLLVAPHPEFEAGDRTGRLGTGGYVVEPNLETMLDQIYGPRALLGSENGANAAAPQPPAAQEER